MSYSEGLEVVHNNQFDTLIATDEGFARVNAQFDTLAWQISPEWRLALADYRRGIMCTLSERVGLVWEPEVQGALVECITRAKRAYGQQDFRREVMSAANDDNYQEAA